MKTTQGALIATIVAMSVLAVATTGAQAPGNSKEEGATDLTLVSKGHTLFLSNCSPCHGAQAQGNDGPNLHRLGLPESAIAATVTSGIKDEMPPFGQKLKGSDLTAVVAYVRSLQ